MPAPNRRRIGSCMIMLTPRVTSGRIGIGGAGTMRENGPGRHHLTDAQAQGQAQGYGGLWPHHVARLLHRQREAPVGVVAPPPRARR
eukprot:5948313-Prymnesium_polylepis.1